MTEKEKNMPTVDDFEELLRKQGETKLANLINQSKKPFQKISKMNGIDNNSNTTIKIDAFSKNDNLLIVERKSYEKNFICDICGKPFGSSAYLYSQHMKMEHNITITLFPEQGEEFENITEN